MSNDTMIIHLQAIRANNHTTHTIPIIHLSPYVGK